MPRVKDVGMEIPHRAMPIFECVSEAQTASRGLMKGTAVVGAGKGIVLGRGPAALIVRKFAPDIVDGLSLVDAGMA